ncbi:MAG: lysophospholipid acyltransferase family protein [Thermoanaerobaculia bacterium]
MARLRSWLRLILVAKTTALFFGLWYFGRLFLIGRLRTRSRWRRFNFGGWARAVLRILKVEVEVVGRPPEPPFLLVSNHLSYLDIVVLSSLADTVFVAKSEVESWPVLGFIVRNMDTIFVDRNLRRDIPRVVAQIEDAFEAGEGVVIFPEGTSTPGEAVAPFRPSLLEPAARGSLPVRTAALGYDTPDGQPTARETVCWWGEMTFRPHFLRLLALPSLSARVAFGGEVVRDSDRKRLAERLEAGVRSLFVPVEA